MDLQVHLLVTVLWKKETRKSGKCENKLNNPRYMDMFLSILLFSLFFFSLQTCVFIHPVDVY